MKLSLALHRRLRWFNLPTLSLLALLQRTPVARIAVVAEEFVLSSPLGAVLKSAMAAAASLGAVNSLAGATEMQSTQPSPAAATVGVSFVVAFSMSGTASDADSWTTTGSVPPGLAFSGLSSPPLVLSGTPTTAGTYNMQIQGHDAIGGDTAMYPYTVVVTGGVTNTAPSFTTHPQTQTVNAGVNVTFTAVATGTPTPTYQWQKNGTNISGSTSATLVLNSVTTAASGSYTVIATNSVRGNTSNTAVLTVIPTSYLANLSVRTTTTAAQTLIVGFVVDGGAKPVLARAAGPALTALGIPGFTGVSDPSLTLFNGANASVGTNNDWSSSLSSTFDTLGAFAFANGSKDSAFQQTINGPHTAQATATNSGAILVEAYDAGPNDGRQLVNLSARFPVGTGDNILIAGFVLAGTGTKQLLIRAVGPRLADFGVTTALADPQLAVFEGATQITSNNDWSASLATTFTTLGAFDLNTGSKDAAIVVTLQANKSYTVQVSGVGGTTGEALVEIYAFP